MIRIFFFLLTFLGSSALLLDAHLTGAGFISSTVMADQTWVALLFTFGALTTILSLFFIGFEMAAYAHRKPPVVINKTKLDSATPAYPPFTGTPITDTTSTVSGPPAAV